MIFDPVDYNNRIRCAVVSFRTRKFEEAIVLASAALSTLPDSGAATCILGRAHFALGQFDEGMSYIEKSPSFADDANALYRCGRRALKYAKYELAASLLGRAAILLPTNGTCLGMAGIAYYRCGRFPKSIELLKAAGSEGVIGGLFRDNLRLARIGRAVRSAAPSQISILLRTIAEREPDWIEPQLWLAERFETTGDLESAHNVHLGISTKFPEFPWSKFKMTLYECEILSRRSLLTPTNEALDRLEAIAEELTGAKLDLAPIVASDDIQSSILALYEDPALQTRRISYLMGLIRNDSANVDVILEIVETELVAGNYALALDLLKQIFSTVPNDQRILFQIAKACFLAGQLEEAKFVLDAHFTRGHTDTASFLLLASLHLASDELEAAELALLRAGRRPDAQSQAERSEVEAEFVKRTGRNPRDERDIDFHADFIEPPATPATFRLNQADEQFQRTRPHLAQGVRNSCRVISALVQREVLTRFGKHHLGYLWAILQPVSFTVVLYILSMLAGRHMPAGMPLFAFLITGIATFQMFSRTLALMSSVLIANRPLYYFRQVTPIAAAVSRFILEFLTNLMVFVILSCFLPLVGEQLNIDDYLGVFWGLFMISVLGAELGLVLSVCGAIFPIVRRLSQSINRILFYTSGLFFYANELPERIREALMINPIFHCIELVRGAFFRNYEAHYASSSYVATWGLCGLFLALAAERFGRKWLLEEN